MPFDADRPAPAQTAAPAPTHTDAALALHPLDVRTLPHGGRHEIIFASLAALEPGQTFVILNDHDPKPLRYQTEALWPDVYTWDYLEAGPALWRVAITRAH
ncbi:hypothetical protein BH11ACT1_BH11ACT1_00260 [soil metagenome]